MTLQANQIGDASIPANFAAGGTLGTFLVNVDTIAPTAALTSAPTVTTPGGTSGIGTVNLAKGGLNGTIGAPTGGITSLSLLGTTASSAGTVIMAGGTAGIGTMTVTGSENLTVTSPGAITTLSVVGTAASPATLSGLITVKKVGTLSATYTNLTNLTIRATDGMGAMTVRSMNNAIISAGTMGNVTVSQNVTGSTASTQQFGIVAHGAIGAGTVKIGGVTRTLPWPVGNITIARNWR